MVIIGTDEYLDNALVTLPIIEYLSKTAGQQTYIILKRPEILTILPKNMYGLQLIDNMEPGLGFHKTYVLNTASLENLQNNYHATVAHYAKLKLPVHITPLKPTVASDLIMPEDMVDILIAPFSNVQMESRAWPLENYQDLINDIKDTYPNLIIGILGSPDSPRLWDSVVYLYDKPLNRIPGYMIKAKCVVTINNEFNRLAHFYSNNADLYHILLNSSVYSLKWNIYPELKNYIHGDPYTWNKTDIRNLIDVKIGEKICH